MATPLFTMDATGNVAPIPLPTFAPGDPIREKKRYTIYELKRKPDGKFDKIPYDFRTGKKANNISLGASLQEIVNYCASHQQFRPGIYLTEEDSPDVVVIDLDRCVDLSAKQIAPWALEIVRDLNSYTELSPSGTGLHIFCRGVKPGGRCRSGIEMYSRDRFVSISGAHVPGTPETINTVDLTSIYNRMLAGEFKAASSDPATRATNLQIGASAEIRHGGGAVTTKLQLLMTGTVIMNHPFLVEDEHGNDIQVPSQSEADMCLANALAVKHEGDLEKIDADFRKSSLYRDKWERADYRNRTIKAAISFYEKLKTASTTETASVSDIVDEDDAEPETLPVFPKFTGLLDDLSTALSPDIPYPFLMTAGFTHFGLIRSSLDTLAAEPHIQPRLYSALVAEPGRGKTAAINEVTKVMRNLSSCYKVYSSIDSGPAMVDAFEEEVRNRIKMTEAGAQLSSTAAKICLNPDEIKDLFEKGKSGLNGRNSFLIEILKLYEANNTGNRSRTAKSKINLDNAHLAILGGATSRSYENMYLGTGGLADGLQSRITVVGVEFADMPAEQRPGDAVKLAEAIQNLIEAAKAPAQQFIIDADARSKFFTWWNCKDQHNPNVTRLDGIAKRVAIILARTNPTDGRVTLPLMEQAIGFADYVFACREKFNPPDAVSYVQMMENLIIAAFKRFGDMTRRQCNQRNSPHKRPGGVEPWGRAWDSLVRNAYLVKVFEEGKKVIYHLDMKE